MGPTALKFFHSLARKNLTKNQGSGIITIPNRMRSESEASAMVQTIVDSGLPLEKFDQFIKSEDDILKYLNIIKNANKPKVIPADSLEGRGIMEALLGKRGEVVDMAGKKLDTSQGIMGGKSVKELMDSGQVTKGPRGMKKSKKIKDREMFQDANKRLKTDVNKIIADIKAMDPMDSMKEANSVIGRKGKYKNLTPEESKKILKDTEDHIFERDIPEEDFADGGVAGLLGERKAFQGGGADMGTVSTPTRTATAKSVSVSPSGNVTTSRTKGPDSPDDRSNPDQDHVQMLVKAGYTPKEINAITNPSAIDKIKQSRFNTPFTRGAARTAAYLYNPMIAGVELRQLMQGKDLYDRTKQQIIDPVYDEEDVTLGMGFADGGPARQNFAMGRRAFLKMLAGTGAGIAGLKSGIIGAGGKSATKKAVTETVKSAGSTPPPYFFKLVDKIKTMGDDVTAKTATQERQQVTRYKDYELTEDVGTGEKTIQRIKIDDGNPQYYDETLAEETYMSYKPGKSQADEATPKVADEYVEDTSYIRTSGPQKGEIYDTVDGVPDDVIQEGTMFEDNITEFGKTKKADGGRIGFDSGGSPLQRLRQSLVDDLMYKFPSMKEEDMQMIVKDINLGMSAEEAQASMSANFIKVFGKSGMFSTGGIARMLGE